MRGIEPQASLSIILQSCIVGVNGDDYYYGD